MSFEGRPLTTGANLLSLGTEVAAVARNALKTVLEIPFPDQRTRKFPGGLIPFPNPLLCQALK